MLSNQLKQNQCQNPMLYLDQSKQEAKAELLEQGGVAQDKHSGFISFSSVSSDNYYCDSIYHSSIQLNNVQNRKIINLNQGKQSLENKEKQRQIRNMSNNRHISINYLKTDDHMDAHPLQLSESMHQYQSQSRQSISNQQSSSPCMQDELKNEEQKQGEKRITRYKEETNRRNGKIYISLDSQSNNSKSDIPTTKNNKKPPFPNTTHKHTKENKLGKLKGICRQQSAPPSSNSQSSSSAQVHGQRQAEQSLLSKFNQVSNANYLYYATQNKNKPFQHIHKDDSPSQISQSSCVQEVGVQVRSSIVNMLSSLAIQQQKCTGNSVQDESSQSQDVSDTQSSQSRLSASSQQQLQSGSQSYSQSMSGSYDVDDHGRLYIRQADCKQNKGLSDSESIEEMQQVRQIQYVSEGLRNNQMNSKCKITFEQPFSQLEQNQFAYTSNPNNTQLHYISFTSSVHAHNQNNKQPSQLNPQKDHLEMSVDRDDQQEFRQQERIQYIQQQVDLEKEKQFILKLASEEARSIQDKKESEHLNKSNKRYMDQRREQVQQNQMASESSSLDVKIQQLNQLSDSISDQESEYPIHANQYQHQLKSNSQFVNLRHPIQTYSCKQQKKSEHYKNGLQKQAGKQNRLQKYRFLREIGEKIEEVGIMIKEMGFYNEQRAINTKLRKKIRKEVRKQAQKQPFQLQSNQPDGYDEQRVYVQKQGHIKNRRIQTKNRKLKYKQPYKRGDILQLVPRLLGDFGNFVQQTLSTIKVKPYKN